jgi:ubiquinone/menaquinone biosynthesis C-methylase UbiE
MGDAVKGILGGMSSEAPPHANPRGVDVNLRSGPQMAEYQAIVRRISADRPGRLLDWGCGWGQVTKLLQESGVDATAFDYRPGAESGIRPMERYPNLSVHFSPDPRRLPFEDESFDSVLSCGVLEHVVDPDASLEEIRRVLVPGGTFYVFKLPNRSSYLEALARRLGLYYHGALEHDRLYDRRAAAALLRRHGFAIVECRRMNMLPLTITSRLAARAAPAIWTINRALSAVPGLNLIATNVEVVATATPRATPCSNAAELESVR